MKTKTFFLLCLLLGIGLIQISAQERAISCYVHISIVMPLSCENKVLIDWVNVDVDGHYVMKLNDGDWSNWVWKKWRFTGTLTIESTGEVFNLDYVETYDRPIYGLCNVVWRVKGSFGTNIIATGVYDEINDTWTLNKAICN
jgi:hypothetical protein